MKLTLPLSIVIPRKTKEDRVFWLNMNVFRNAHYQVMSDAKILYKDHVLLALTDVPLPERLKWKEHINGPYRFTYRIFPPNHRAFDLANVCPSVQKFTDDALIELGYLKDDNYKIVSEINYRFGGVDKLNPRAELEIEHV